MMLDCDGVETGKVYTMKRFNDQRNYLNIFRAAKAVVTVSFLGYWCLPAVMASLETAGDWLCRVSSVVDNHSFVFIVINVLIISILFLSREKSETESDLYDQYTSAVVYPVPVVREDSRDKDIVPVKSMTDYIPVAERRPENTVMAKEEDRVVRCGEAVMEVRRKNYRRSESSSFVTAKMMKRSERVIAWEPRVAEGMSSEEYRVTVERFVIEKKRTMQHENDVVVSRRGHNSHFTSGSGRNNCSALVRS